MSAGAGIAFVLTLVLALGTARLVRAVPSCPSFTKSSAANDHGCDVAAVEGSNPSEARWREILAEVAQGPKAWGVRGPAAVDLDRGCENARKVPAAFPCELVRAIAWHESYWRQFCAPSTPADQRGKSVRTLISFDCGYGAAQVTSGMRAGEAPLFDRRRVAADALYNLATGASILARKWQAVPCVGGRDPAVIEDWYLAVWAYNGLSYSNNPANPIYDAARAVYDPTVGGAYPYQEKIFGLIEHPPAPLRRAQGEGLALAYPRLDEMAARGQSPRPLAEPACASPTDCVARRQVHRTSCPPFTAGAPDAGARDASSPSRDAGLALHDTSAAASAARHSDAASGAPSAGGCRCDVGHRAPVSAAAAGVLGLLALGLWQRRRKDPS